MAHLNLFLVVGGASRQPAKLLYIFTHVLVVFTGAQFVAHRLGRLLGVGRSIVSRRFVEISDGRPSTRAGAEGAAIGPSAYAAFTQVDVAEDNLLLVLVLKGDSIPSWCLLFSSASSIRCNKADKHGFVSINVRFDELVKVCRSQRLRVCRVHVRGPDNGGQQAGSEEEGCHADYMAARCRCTA